MVELINSTSNNRNFWGWLLRYLQMRPSVMRNTAEANPNTFIKGTIRKRKLFTVRPRFYTRARVLQRYVRCTNAPAIRLHGMTSCPDDRNARIGSSTSAPCPNISARFVDGGCVSSMKRQSRASRFNNGSTDTASRSTSAHRTFRLSGYRGSSPETGGADCASRCLLLEPLDRVGCQIRETPICMWQDKNTFPRLS